MIPLSSQGGRLAVVRGVADLIEYAYGLRHRDAAGAVAAARRAVTAVEGLPVATCAGRDLRSKAWAVLGNSLRISGSLAAAGQALDVSERLRLRGSGSASLQLLSLQFRASLAISSHRFEDADAYLANADALAEETGDGLQASSVRIKRAIVATYRGDSAEAARILDNALDRGEWTRELRRSALETLMFTYALGEDPLSTLKVWLMSGPYFMGCGELVKLKLRWVRGLVAAQLFGDLHHLEELQADYAGREMGHEAALVGVDLAVCAARAGDSETAKARLAEAGPVLAMYRLESGGESLGCLKALRLALSAAAPS